MNTSELIHEVEEIKARVDYLLTRLRDGEPGTVTIAPVVPAPPIPAAPAIPLGEVDPATGMLKGYREVSGYRVDPIVGPGTPTTVTLPSGHVLSKARADLGEMFMGYCIRISDQAQGSINVVGSLAMVGDSAFDKVGGYKTDGSNWPEAADRFYTPKAYMTPEEREKVQADEDAWAVSMGKLKSP